MVSDTHICVNVKNVIQTYSSCIASIPFTNTLPWPRGAVNCASGSRWNSSLSGDFLPTFLWVLCIWTCCYVHILIFNYYVVMYSSSHLWEKMDQDRLWCPLQYICALHPWVWASEREYMLYDEDEVVGQMLMTKQQNVRVCWRQRGSDRNKIRFNMVKYS